MSEVDLDELAELARRLDLGECEVSPPPLLPGMRVERVERDEIQFVYVIREPQFVVWPWVMLAVASSIGGACLGILCTLGFVG